MMQNFREFRKSFVGLEKSQQFISTQYDDIIKKLDCVNEIQERVVLLEDDSAIKDREIANLNNRVAQLEQYSRNTSFEIREFNEEPNESIEDIVINVAKALNVQIDSIDIQAAHRIPTMQKKINPIIVQLNNRKKRDAIVVSKKILVLGANNSVEAVSAVKTGNKRIYVGESVSQYYKDLLWKAKQWNSANDFKYAWFKKNCVMVRKGDGTKIFKIYNEGDLLKIKNLPGDAKNERGSSFKK